MQYEPQKNQYTALQTVFIVLFISCFNTYCYISSCVYYGLLLMVSFALQQICLWRFPRKRVLLGKSVLFLTYFFPVFFNLKDNIDIDVSVCFIVACNFITIVSFYLINKRDIQILLSKEYIKQYSQSLSRKKFYLESYSLLIMPIAEEVFFRKYCFSLITPSAISIIVASLIISLFFVLSHYNSPWGPFVMGKKDLLWLFILSEFLIILKLSYRSIVLCILVHYIFNLPAFLGNYLRMRKKLYTSNGFQL